MEKIVHKGVHGTTKIAAQSIQKQGFKISQHGRAGSGIYFWHVNIYAESLAIDWVYFENGPGVPVTIIYADLACEENEILDMENQVFADQLATTAMRRNIMPNSGKKEISALYDYYVASLEKKLGTTFRLIKKKLAPPPANTRGYPIIAVGAPLAYIVRDVSIIQIGKVVDK